MLGLLVELLLMRVSLPFALGLTTVLSVAIGTLCPILRQRNCTQIAQLLLRSAHSKGSL